MLNLISQILSEADSKNNHIPPTFLYNEGWMLRLVLNFFATHDIKNFQLSFCDRTSWYSEALLPTQFYAQKRGDKLAESWTHADGVFGDFTIGESAKGDLKLIPNPKVFVAMEAKMFSGLSPNITNVNYYNQAARYVACIAEVLNRANADPISFLKLGFYVLAPEVQINKVPTFRELVTNENIKQIVYRRADEHTSKEKIIWYNDIFLPVINQIDVAVISWEDIITVITDNDSSYGLELLNFYQKCLGYNRIKKALKFPPLQII